MKYDGQDLRDIRAKNGVGRPPEVTLAKPWFPALGTETVATADKGSIRLGSGCITGEFPAR